MQSHAISVTHIVSQCSAMKGSQVQPRTPARRTSDGGHMGRSRSRLPPHQGERLVTESQWSKLREGEEGGEGEEKGGEEGGGFIRK